MKKSGSLFSFLFYKVIFYNLKKNTNKYYIFLLEKINKNYYNLYKMYIQQLKYYI